MLEEEPEKIAGLLLAAGSSIRMGVNKLFLDLEGRTVVRRAAQAASGAGLDPLLVVVGHEAERSREEVRGIECQPVFNAQYAEGIASSLKAGIRALPSDVDAAVVILADMPLVTSAMTAALIARYRETHARLVISDYEGVNAPPMLYDRSLFEELLASDDARCGRQVVQRHLDEAQVLAWPRRALADLDLPEDVERVRSELRQT
jgi:molybdenum cofactor cytidylyltransferase